MIPFLWVTSVFVAFILGYYLGCRGTSWGFYQALGTNPNVPDSIKRLRLLIRFRVSEKQKGSNGEVH